MPPSDLIPTPNRNELTRRSLQALQVESPGPQMFPGAEDVTIHGGEFNAVDQRTFMINNYVLELPATISQEGLTRLLSHSDIGSGAMSISGIGSGMSSPNNVRSEQQVAPNASASVDVFSWRENIDLPTPDFRELAASTFYESFIELGRGLPIWNPVPNLELPISYRRKGVSIGDLGLITEFAAFEYLFNIALPLEHPDNPRALPNDLFSPTPVGRILTAHTATHFKPLTSKGVSFTDCEDGSGILFKSSSSSTSRGAIIALPLGFNSYDIANEGPFRRQFLQNALKWYGYALDQIGSRARNGDLCLVIGNESSKACGLAAFAIESGEIEFNFGKAPEVEGVQTYRWRDMRGTRFWQGNKAHPGVEEIRDLRGGEMSEQGCIYENLCFFVRTLNARLSEDLWAELQSASDSRYPGHVPEGGGGSSNIAGQSSHVDRFEAFESTKPAPSSPSNTINEYLLKTKRDAKMAITSDNQWISILKEDDSQFPHSEELMQRILDMYTIELEDGVVFLEPKTLDLDSVSQDQLLNTPSEQKTSSAGAGEVDLKQVLRNYYSPNVSRQVDPPIISTASPESGHHLDHSVDSPDSDTGTLDSEDSECSTPCSSESAGSFQPSGVSGKVDSRFSVGIPSYRADTGDAMREPPLSSRQHRDEPGQTHRGRH